MEFMQTHKDQNHQINSGKPNPNMIIRAAKIFNIDLNNSILIGDRTSDIIAGLKSGIKSIIHTKTGHGLKEERSN